MKIPAAARLQWGIGLVLVLTTLAVYWPVHQFEFVNYDDNDYVSHNPIVKRGLTWDGVRWAFTNQDYPAWHPLTWLSLMADAEWAGTDAGGYHVTNLLLHAANTGLLFVVLAAMTGAPWRSAWVAAVFGLHPLHVESVAWVTARKDVLSGLFWILTLGAYLRYVRTRRWTWYGWTTLGFVLGVLAKAMAVTLPFVLLLLDVWPLRRVTDIGWPRLLREKIPLFMLAVLGSGMTVFFEPDSRAPLFDLGSRLATALVAYASYLHKMIWPTRLTYFYLHPGQWSGVIVTTAALVLAGLTLLAVRTRRQHPAILVGWCWYLGTLVPVIGLVQVGVYFMADRYTYLPLVGIWIALAWGLTEWATGRPFVLRLLAGAGLATVLACIPLTWRQVGTWHNSVTLSRHAVAVTKNNVAAHNNLGAAYEERGQIDEATRQYELALRLQWGGYAMSHFNLGRLLARAQKFPEAIDHFNRAVQIKPDYVEAHTQLASALTKTGRTTEALRHYQQVVRILPKSAEAHHNLAIALRSAGRLTEAIAHYQQARQFQPTDPAIHCNLGAALTDAGRFTEAIDHYQQALRLDPALPEAHYNLAIALRRAGRPADAQPHFAQALRLKPALAAGHEQFALTLQQAGQLADAIVQYELVLQTQPDALAPLNNLAWLRATAADPALRDGATAVRLAERAADLTGRRLPEYLDTLAAAYAEAGRWPEAVATAEQALTLARATNRSPLAIEIQRRLEQYRAAHAWREPER